MMLWVMTCSHVFTCFYFCTETCLRLRPLEGGVCLLSPCCFWSIGGKGDDSGASGSFFSGDTFCWRGFRDSELNFDPWRSPVPLSVHLSVLCLFFITFPSVTVHCFQTSLNCCVPLSYTLEFVASIFSFNSRASVCAVTEKNMSLKVCWGLIKGIWTLRLVLFVQTFSRRVFFGCFWTALAPSTPPHQCLHRSVSSFWDMMRRISEPLTPFFLHFWKKPSNSCLTHASAVCISHQCLHFSVSPGVMCIIWVAWQSPVCACSIRRQTQTTQFLNLQPQKY